MLNGDYYLKLGRVKLEVRHKPPNKTIKIYKP